MRYTLGVSRNKSHEQRKNFNEPTRLIEEHYSYKHEEIDDFHYFDCSGYVNPKYRKIYIDVMQKEIPQHAVAILNNMCAARISQIIKECRKDIIENLRKKNAN